jgi:hypothetical protein
MADDGMTAERQNLLDDVELYNELLARMSVVTPLPMSAAVHCTTDELRLQVAVLRRDYQNKRYQLGGT